MCVVVPCQGLYVKGVSRRLTVCKEKGWDGYTYGRFEDTVGL